jgi:Uma2 family endonuclease
MTARTLFKTALPELGEQSLFDFLDRQGSFSEKEYLALTDDSNRLVEFTDGYLEILPMPTDYHQCILKFMFLALHDFVTPLGGMVHFAVLRLRIRKGKFREPDLLLLLSKSDPRRQNRFWTGADLVLEVVSKDKPERELVVKRHDFVSAKIPEYWIVNPMTEKILVLGLSTNRYRRLGNEGRGGMAKSSVLSGFEISVDEVFDSK